MKWDEILKYKELIIKIAAKYSNDADLAEDVVHEVMLKLFEDKKLDTSKFKNKEAAIGNVIRNKTLKVLRSRKIGRWQFESLEKMREDGFQFDESERVHNPNIAEIRDFENQLEEGRSGDNNINPPEEE